MAAKKNTERFFPKITPYHTGYLDVGDGHSMYYEECGNLKGYPILYVHGGPGGGCSTWDRRFFNPKKWRIILFDQRGSGKSKPFAETKKNTTWHLIKDINLLLDTLGIKKTVLFGGSWGSTLSLVFAINYPEKVSGMVISGIWLADIKALEDYLLGVKHQYFPELWERFVSLVPASSRKNICNYYYRKMTSGNKKTRKRFAYEWAYYESAMCSLKWPEESALKKEILKSSYQGLAVLEAHYYKNKGFLKEGYIIKNAAKMKKIPASFIQGRYDAVCPPRQAWELKKALTGAKLHFVLAGHCGDAEVTNKMIAETEKMYLRVAKNK